jgi:hypothetical protein
MNANDDNDLGDDFDDFEEGAQAGGDDDDFGDFDDGFQEPELVQSPPPLPASDTNIPIGPFVSFHAIQCPHLTNLHISPY